MSSYFDIDNFFDPVYFEGDQAVVLPTVRLVLRATRLVAIAPAGPLIPTEDKFVVIGARLDLMLRRYVLVLELVPSRQQIVSATIFDERWELDTTEVEIPIFDERWELDASEGPADIFDERWELDTTENESTIFDERWEN